MNLLDATATVLDLAKTHAHESDRVAQAAIKRVEKRLHLLRIRAAKNRRRLRHHAWWILMWHFKGGWLQDSKVMVIECPQCDELVDFGHVCRSAVISGRGAVVKFDCPHCGFALATGKNVTSTPNLDLQRENRRKRAA